MGTDIEERLQKIKAELPLGVRLVAVSKFQPIEALMQAYDAGQRLFGESRVQEVLTKIPRLPADVCWHFIGHLQTNKVKHLVGKVAMIESVDSERLLFIINEESKKMDVVSDILLQVHVAEEESKFGFSPEELQMFFSETKYRNYPNVRIRGLMAMATNTDHEERVKKDFESASTLYGEISTSYSTVLPDFNILSMGMSGDWPLAVECGANLIRIGSAIFGERKY